jgi:hypothetical protein
MGTQLALQGALIDAFNWVLVALWLVIVLFNLFALVDCAIRRGDAFNAAGKQTKPFWVIILAVPLVLDYFFARSVFSFIAILGLVATTTYVVDVRPAVRAATPRRGGRNNRDNHMGPYGPW